MSSIQPPSTVSTSSPGQTANTNSNSQSNAQPLYDINYAYQQQSAKNNPKNNLRYTLSIPGANGKTIIFKAHIDPNHLIFSNEKRIVELDVLTGVVIQDFGFNTQILELKGTTGSAYYNEILQLGVIFHAQSAKGQPSAVSISIEGFNYKATWKEFVYDRQNTAAGGNTINYTMSFVIIPGFVKTSTEFLGKVPGLGGVINQVSTNGLSITAYLKSLPSIPLPNLGLAQQYVQNNWSSYSNNGAAFPGLNVPLLPTQVINVPGDWSSVFNGQYLGYNG
jgi:hypothetical protein